jgi:hypothetical protein
MFNNKPLLFLLRGIAFLFICFLFIVIYNIRPCSDDLAFMIRLSEKGWFYSIAEFQYNIRWSSYLLLNSIFYFNQDFQTIHWNIFIYYVLLFSFFYYALSNLIKVLFERFFSKINGKDSLLLAILFSIPLYFITTESIEVWFWVSGSVVYFVPSVFFIWGLGLIVSKNNSKLNYIGIFTAFFLIGGTLESFALITIFFLFSLFIFITFPNKKPSRAILLKLIIAIVSTSLLLLLELTNNGIGNRLILISSKKQFQNSNNFEIIFRSLKEIKNIFLLIYFVLIMIIGKIISKYGINFNSLISFKKLLLTNAILLIVVFVITFTPLLYAFHSIEPKRAWYPFNFVLWGSLISICLFLGNVYQKQLYNRFTIYFTSIACLGIISFHLINQTKKVALFSFKYDQRIETLIRINKSVTKKVFHLNPLPDSGVIASAELRETNGATNQNLKKVLHLNYVVLLKSKK